ncbi:Flp pilus assembly complex ATPase component TadA [Patescibacteria group bacterium]|nr:Flp pilus assembly complex ATPase component TadA [Patescibacteria group bacterium]
MVNFEKEVNIEAILSKISSNEAVSDIHISSDEYISFRVNGEIQKYEKTSRLAEEYVEIMLKHLMKGNQKAYEKFVGDKEADFSYISMDGTPYRVNAYFKLGKIGIVMRKINSVAKELKDLMFSDVADTIKQKILSRKTGLIIVTGPTGSGKSTSIVSMIEHINNSRSENIITIEDPIEFIFKPQKSIISQREVGHDTWSFMNALRSTMREDPNVVFVGEIRDKETAESVLSLAET